jgi:hypothetical protein
MKALRALVACVALGVLALAGASTASVPAPRPGDFVDRVDNAWFPLRPGTTFVYRGSEDGEPMRRIVRVTSRVKVVQGVRCTVVDDRVYLGGKLHERTDDWFAQHRDGTVWYFGEDTAELDENGRVKTRQGSWEAGKGGATAGVYMPARPRVGQTFRQEYYKGHAEDWFRIVSLRASVSVPFVSSTRALQTREWTPLEPGVIDRKLYVRGVGTVKEETIKGGDEVVELVAIRRS